MLLIFNLYVLHQHVLTIVYLSKFFSSSFQVLSKRLFEAQNPHLKVLNALTLKLSTQKVHLKISSRYLRAPH